MPILENNFDDDILELIVGSTEVDSNYSEFDESIGHYIRMSVFDENDEFIRSYYSDLTWTNDQLYYNESYMPYSDSTLSTAVDLVDDDGNLNLQLPIYRDTHGKIFVKPNDTLAADPDIEYNTANYSLKFDFFDDVFSHFVDESDTPQPIYDNPRFYLREISTSRSEVRLLGRQGENELLDLNESFRNVFNDITIFETGTGEYEYNFIFTLPNAVDISITNHSFDTVSLNTNSLVLKLYDTVPLDIDAPSNIPIGISREIYSTHIENIFYIAETLEDIEYVPLVPDTGAVANTTSPSVDSIQSHNDLITSTSLDNGQQSVILRSIFSASDNNTNIDYSEFQNHAFFGSAELKVRNFYNKVKDIEDKLNIISSSITDTNGFVTESGVVVRRKTLFKEINDIIGGFTPYEKWLYYDTTTTSSYPNAGLDYSYSPPISGSFIGNNYVDISTDAQVLRDYFGFNPVFKITTQGDETITSGSFETGSGDVFDIHRYWFTGSNGWDVTNGTASYSAASNTELIQIYTGSIGTNDTFDVNTAVDPIKVKNFNQFKVNTAYNISFDVTKVDTTGTITFQFGGYGATGDQTNLPVRKSFSVSSTGTFNGNIDKIPSSDNSGQFIDSPYNYLTIFTTGFEGVIDNVSVVESTDSDGRADIFTDKYRVENSPLYNQSGSFYLSFLAKWPVLPTWENYNASQSGDIGNPIPRDAWSGHYTQSADADDTKFNHYILAASQSYWRFKPGKDSDRLDTITSNDSTYWEILSGSNATGSYGMSLPDGYGYYDNIMTYGSSSMLPSGELYRLYHVTSSEPVPPVTSSFLMDVKLFREDTLWGGDPSDILLFSNMYSTSSIIVQNWFNNQIDSASKYDDQNVHSLYNNLPLFTREGDDDKVLNKFISLIGEHYDLLKNYIDNYISTYTRNYDSKDGIPYGLLSTIGEHFGWNFINTNSLKNLLEYYVGVDQSFTHEDLTRSIWRNILNNLIYIYKTKGTENSVRALSNCFGIPPDIVSITEGGSAIQSQTNPQVDFRSTSGVRATSGNISFREYRKFLQLLNFNSNNNSFKTDWNTNSTGLTTGVEFVLSSFNTSNTEKILESSGSGGEELWNLELLATSSNDTSASLRFRLNTSETGSLSIESNNVSISSDYFPVKDVNNRKLWNVLIQRETTPPTSSYKLYFVNRVDDTIQHYFSGSLVVTSSFANDNFIGTGSLSTPVTDNLVIGETLTGSLTEFRVWNTSLTESKFLQHVFNPESVVGNNQDGFESNVIRYNYKGNFVSPNSESLIRDIGSQVSGNFSKTLGSGFKSPTFKKQYINVFRFDVRSINLNSINTNKITISKTPTLIRSELSPFSRNIRDELFVDTNNEPLRIGDDNLRLSISPSSIVNEILSDNVSDHYLGDLIGKASDEESDEYSGIITLREKVTKRYTDEIADINQFNRKYSLLIPSEFWNILQDVVPSKVNVSSGIEIYNPFLWRNKHPRLDGKRKYDDQTIFKLNDTLVVEDQINLGNSKNVVFLSNTESNLLEYTLDDTNLQTSYDTKIDEILTDDKLSSEKSTFHISEDLELESILNPQSENDDILKADKSLSNEIEFDSTINDEYDVDLYSITDKYEETLLSENVIFNSVELDTLENTDISSETQSTYDSNINIEDEKEINSETSNIPETTLDRELDDIVADTGTNLTNDDSTEVVLEQVDDTISSEKPVDLDPTLDLEIDDTISAEKINVPEDTIEQKIEDPTSEVQSIPDSNVELEIEKIIKSNSPSIPEDSIDKIDDYNIRSETEQDKSTDIEDFFNDDMVSAENDGNKEITIEVIDNYDSGFNSSYDTLFKSEIDTEENYPIDSTEFITILGKDDVSIDKSEIFDQIFDFVLILGSQNPLQDNETGDSTEIGNIKVEESTFTNFDYSKFLDPDNDSFRIHNPVTNEYTGKGKYKSLEAVFYSLGDVETINLFGTNKNRLRLKNLFTKVVDAERGGRFFSKEFDTTNPDFFTNQLTIKLNNETKKVGRTTLIFVYEHWFDTHVQWGDKDCTFEWETNPGTIFYPLNHFHHMGSTLDDMPVYESTIYSGGDVPNDPLHQITTTEAVIINDVGSKGTGKGNQLKVVTK